MEVIIYTLLVAGEQQKASLEKAVDIAQEKAIFFNMMDFFHLFEQKSF